MRTKEEDMGRNKTQHEFGTEVVVCVMSFASAHLPGDTVIRQGARLRATDAIVQWHPEYFADDGLSDSEINARITALGGLIS
jgi:hypothetical protein